MIGFALIVLAMLLAAALGMHAGRMAERRVWTADRLAPERKAAFEDALRKARGIRRLHPDPDSAVQIHKGHVRRK